MAHAVPAPPGFRLTVACLSVGQILSWAALYYAFSSFVLPMQRELHWDKATMMGALTLGLAVWGATTFAVGSAIDRGHGRAVMSTRFAAGGRRLRRLVVRSASPGCCMRCGPCSARRWR